jgi:hypothetical protein
MHLGNIAFAIPGLEKHSEHQRMDYSSHPECIPVVPREYSKCVNFYSQMPRPSGIHDGLPCLGFVPDSSSICVKTMRSGNGVFHPISVRGSTLHAAYQPSAPLINDSLRGHRVVYKRLKSSPIENLLAPLTETGVPKAMSGLSHAW